MRKFQCPACGNPIYFENTTCGRCQAVLALDPVTLSMAAYRIDDANGQWLTATQPAQVAQPCSNRVQHNVCNWMVPAGDPGPYCPSCRLTSTIPSLGEADNWRRWAVIETAKRRLMYTLLKHRIPVRAKQSPEDTHGLEFRWLQSLAGEKVMTGHENGVVTLDIAEADDDVREAVRVSFGEPLRTVLGHLRHEVSHHLHQRWVEGGPFEEQFRTLFGDERADYQAALQHYYDNGAAPGWDQSFISAYASAHPWEDFAETCAHHLLMLDAVESAASWELQFDDGVVGQTRIAAGTEHAEERSMVLDNWMPLARLLNSMSRSLGLPDSYPFAISEPVLQKLDFVRRALRSAAGSQAAPGGPAPAQTLRPAEPATQGQ